MSVLLVGCASPRHFELAGADSNIVFPAAPDSAKLRYQGTLIGEANLARDITDTSRLKKIGQFIIGLPRYQIKPENMVRPVAAVADVNGTLYVVDGGKKSVLRIDPLDASVKWIKTAGKNQSFASPIAIAEIWDGLIAVSDSALGVVFVFDSLGNPVTTLGKNVLERPVGLVYDTLNDHLLVADSLADNIKVFDRAGVLQDVIGSSGTVAGQFNGPTYLAYKAPWLAVSDTLNSRIQLINLVSEEIRIIGQQGLRIGNFVRPKGVAFDSDFNLYAVESYHDYLLIYNLEGALLMAIGGNGQQHGQFNLPGDLFIDANDQIYIADTLNGRVEVFQYLGDS